MGQAGGGVILKVSMAVECLISSVFPAKAVTQIHPERLVGFVWTPAFAGETGWN
jgi:hypothetical protein